MKDLVVLSLERWDDVWRRNQYLVDGLLRTDPALRVLFVEPPDDPLHAVRSGARPSLGQPPRRIADRLWTTRGIKWLPRRIDPRADDRLARQALRAAARLGMSAPLLWVNDPAAATISRLSGWPTLYDMTDDWLAADRPEAERRRIAAGEALLLSSAAAVVACSPELVRRKQHARPVIHLVRNAVDTAAYRREHPRPADLPAGRTALYLGTLHRDRLDVDLCIATAAALRGVADLVLVGPDLLDSETSARLADAGVRVLGARPREEVIGYLQHADALLVPHVVTAFTESLDPLKLYEYQAVGNPVVSTPVAGFREAEDPRIRIVTREHFPDAVRAAITAPASSVEGEPAPQRPAISAPDWSERVTAMRAILDGIRVGDVPSGGPRPGGSAALDDQT